MVFWSIFIGVWKICHHLELHDFNAKLISVLLNSVLGIIWAVEILASAVLAWTSMVTTDDEVCSTVILTDDGMPDGFTRTAHTHGKTKQT